MHMRHFSADGLNAAGDPLPAHFLSGLISSGDPSSELFEERPWWMTSIQVDTPHPHPHPPEGTVVTGRSWSLFDFLSAAPAATCSLMKNDPMPSSVNTVTWWRLRTEMWDFSGNQSQIKLISTPPRPPLNFYSSLLMPRLPISLGLLMFLISQKFG